MSERTMTRAAAYRKTLLHTLDIIDYYIKNHKDPYVTFEKNCAYDWALQKARDAVAKAYGKNAASPIDVLECLLVKYDTWAHTDTQSSEQFKAASAAIEDLIDTVLTS